MFDDDQPGRPKLATAVVIRIAGTRVFLRLEKSLLEQARDVAAKRYRGNVSAVVRLALTRYFSPERTESGDARLARVVRRELKTFAKEHALPTTEKKSAKFPRTCARCPEVIRSAKERRYHGGDLVCVGCLERGQVADGDRLAAARDAKQKARDAEVAARKTSGKRAPGAS